MTEKVLLSISGLQSDIDGNEAVEMIAPASYRLESSTHILTFDEPADSESMSAGVNKYNIMLSEKKVEIIKTGHDNTHMIFETGKCNRTLYETEYGGLDMGLYTRSIKIQEAAEQITATLLYSLDIDYCHLSERSVCISIRAL